MRGLLFLALLMQGGCFQLDKHQRMNHSQCKLQDQSYKYLPR
jgi:hypothetical protein